MTSSDLKDTMKDKQDQACVERNRKKKNPKLSKLKFELSSYSSK
jgi:hypothetical protein